MPHVLKQLQNLILLEKEWFLCIKSTITIPICKGNECYSFQQQHMCTASIIQEPHEAQQEQSSCRGTTLCVTEAGGQPAGKQLARRGPEVLMNTKLSRSQQWALGAKKANSVLGCIRSVASRSKRKILLFYSVLMRPQLVCCVYFWEAWTYWKKSSVKVGTKMTKKLEHLFHEERQWELGLFSLQERRLFINMYKIPEECKEYRARLFLEALFFPIKRDRTLIQAVELLGDLPKPLEHGPTQLLWVALLQPGLGLMDPEHSASPGSSMI